jgi:hypothetical protein
MLYKKGGCMIKKVMCGVIFVCLVAIGMSVYGAVSRQPAQYAGHDAGFVQSVIIDEDATGCTVRYDGEDGKDTGCEVRNLPSSALQCEAFINALGSQRKIEFWYDEVTAQGVTARIVKKVHYFNIIDK